MSLPEVMLWQRLRGRKAGPKFRRQHPIGSYVADFYCRETSLIVEVDGQSHELGDRPGRDESRTAFFSQNGYRVLRIAAADILRDVEAVAASIGSLVAGPLHQPSAGPPPRAGED